MPEEANKSPAHYRLGPSSAYMWMACEGQPNMAALSPPSRSGPAARQGTAAHEVLELCWPLFQNEPSDFEGEAMKNGYVIKREDVEALEESIEILKDVGRDIKSGYDVYSEDKHALPVIHEHIGGTMDINIPANDRSILKVIDYKHGKKVVNVVDNKQLKIYALIAIYKYTLEHNLGGNWGDIFKRVEVSILQPRAPHGDGIFRTWHFTPDAINAFASELFEAAKKTDNPEAPLKAGDHCGWCTAKYQCKELQSKSNEVAKGAFDPIKDPKTVTLPDPRLVPLEDLLKLKEFEGVFKNYFSGVNDHLLGLIKQGVQVPGYKAVRKKSNRSWKNVKMLVNTVNMMVDDPKDVLYAPPKLKTPAQLEKIKEVGKTVVAGLCIKPDNGEELAPIDDARPAVPMAATEKLTAIPDKGAK